jgi:hypothetical protein
MSLALEFGATVVVGPDGLPWVQVELGFGIGKYAQAIPGAGWAGFSRAVTEEFAKVETELAAQAKPAARLVIAQPSELASIDPRRLRA